MTKVATRFLDLAMLLVCLAAAHAQQNVALAACPKKPEAGKDCLSRDVPGGGSDVISADDYYNVYIESVCVDQPDGWWHQKMVLFTVTLQIGTDKSVNVPVFSDHAGNGCRLPVNHYPLLTAIPANGNPLTISAEIDRSKSDDGLKKILAFASSTQQQPQLATYAASAVPYLSMASAFANQAYNTFGSDKTIWLQAIKLALSPMSPLHTNTFDLRDGYFVQYSGPDEPADAELYVDDSHDLRWPNGSFVRGSATWILYRIQKYPRRTDYPTRTWYTSWQTALNDASINAIDAPTLKNRFQQSVVLLQNDADFTLGDKRQYISEFSKAMNAVLTELDKPAPDLAGVRDAIAKSTETAVAVHADLADPAKTITAVGTDKPTLTFNVPLGSELRAVVPEKLAMQLEKMSKPQ